MVAGGASSGMSSALHRDKPGAIAVKIVAGAALGGAAKMAGDKVAATLSATPKPVPGQMVTWGASKSQTAVGAAVGVGTDKGIAGGGKAAVNAGCKEQGSCSK